MRTKTTRKLCPRAFFPPGKKGLPNNEPVIFLTPLYYHSFHMPCCAFCSQNCSSKIKKKKNQNCFISICNSRHFLIFGLSYRQCHLISIRRASFLSPGDPQSAGHRNLFILMAFNVFEIKIRIFKECLPHQA